MPYILLFNFSVDIWSVGCIFAELMSRKILFQSGSPVQQLNKIVSLLGTPSIQDLNDAKASRGAITYLLSKQHKPVSQVIYCISPAWWF